MSAVADLLDSLQNSPSACLRHENPNRLMSLLEIMQPFHAHTFLSLTRMMETVIRMPLGSHLDDEYRTAAQATFGDAAQMCAVYSFTASKISAEKILSLLSKKECPYEKFRELVGELQERIIDEMSPSRFFSLSDQEAEYYNNWSKGWKEIIDRFPGATTDIEEMHKCFGLSRYAAAVFHSVQVIEHALIELGVFLSVTDRKEGWVATSNELKRIATTEYKNRSQFENDNFTFIEQMHGLVEALKNAWRHKISHASGRLAVLSADFKPDTAEDIVSATRAFMRRLATDLEPKPVP